MKNTVPKQHTPSEPTPIIIDVTRAIELLQGVVGEVGYDHQYDGPYMQPYPDHAPDVWTPCYVADGVPVDLVARALTAAGVPAEEIHRYEGASAIELFGWLSDSGLILSSVEAQCVFSHAQTEQDDGAAWGRVVASARALVAEDVTSC